MRIGKKTIHSVIIGLAMALPILYLGGSMIAGLAGAHSDKYYDTYAYSVNENASVFQMSDSILNTEGTAEGDPNNLYILENVPYIGSFVVGHHYYFHARINVVSGDVQRWRVRYPMLTALNYVSDENVISGFYDFTTSSERFCFQILAYGSFSVTFDLIQFVDLTLSFPNKSFSEIEAIWNGNFQGEYFSKGYTSVDYGVEETGDYASYVSSTFFPKDNFVERIGQNALSGIPKGFAPFGVMLSYLDSNVFHAGDSQTALMVYGMVYWSLHVVLADLVYHVLVFVPNLINRVFDWFGQKGVSDE